MTDSEYNIADLKIEKDSETFRQFEQIIKRQGYTNFKAGILVAMNFYVQHFTKSEE